MGQPQKKPARASHKPRKGNSDYTYDDLVNTAGFEHMFSFLKTRHPDAPVPAADAATRVGAPDFGAPVKESDQDNIDAPTVVAPTSGAPDLTALSPSGGPFLSASNLSAPDLLDSPIDTYDLTGPGIAYDLRRYQPRPTRTAQDGHTIGEQELYEALWTRSKQVGAHARAITIGERTMARELLQTPRSYSSVQENLRSLAAKLALDILPGRPNAPKTYLIYSYEEILRRRRQAGLTYYRKRASAVELIRGDTTSGAPTISAPALHAET